MAEKIQENLPAAGAVGLCSSSDIESPGNTCVFYYKITFLELQPYMFVVNKNKKRKKRRCFWVLSLDLGEERMG